MRSLSGWIRLHRAVRENWTFKEKRKFSRFEAWIDLLLEANHKDNKFILGSELVECKRGQIVISKRQLETRWGWSNTKVDNFLELLEKDGMVTHFSDNKKTVITIENYDLYQSSNDTETPQEHHTSETETFGKHMENEQTRMINNDKNEKEDIVILSEDENKFISILSKIENYPLDRKKDLEMYHSLDERYPELDLLEAIEDFRQYKMDKPLQKKSNPRSQINTSFKNYVKWGKCLKKNKPVTKSETYEDENPFLNRG